jgi:UV DNA damage endonuclease
MKIGYPCINRSVHCKGNRTFRLKSYSEAKFLETVRGNIACLQAILEYNVHHGLLFFRISSDIIPFASHPICTVPWWEIYANPLRELGAYITRHGLRISMHPDQFIVINSLREDVVHRSVAELRYHARLLDAMHLDDTAKIQLHVGGVYGNKQESIKRFIRQYETLDGAILHRLVIENDDRSYTLSDCMAIHEETGIPVLFDTYHHQCNNKGEDVVHALSRASSTWSSRDGILMVDYSSGEPGAKAGTHARTIDLEDFRQFVYQTRGIDFDIMLEIKDKEQSALRALASVSRDDRVVRG